MILHIDNTVLLADGFKDAWIGMVTISPSNTVALYDIEKCIQILMEKNGMTDEEAIEFMDYNVISANVGEKTPAYALLFKGNERDLIGHNQDS